jgi:nucleotide-binding universal stress UspA family protein
LVTISLDELRKISEEKLAETKHQIESITGGKLKVYTESKLGDTSEEVKLLCETLKPFAVIMGTRGVTGVGRLFLGSNTMAVVDKVSVPVFVIPPGSQFKPIKKVGLATDLRDVVEHTSIGPVKDICTFFNSELHVIHVDFERRHFTAYTPEESLNLDTLLSGLNPVYHFIEHKDIEEGISEFAEKNNMDLIILFPKKHNLLESLFEKSHTRDLIHQTHIPLMCVHPPRK